MQPNNYRSLHAHPIQPWPPGKALDTFTASHAAAACWPPSIDASSS